MNSSVLDVVIFHLKALVEALEAKSQAAPLNRMGRRGVMDR
jgi:hypothetical protein